MRKWDYNKKQVNIFDEDTGEWRKALPVEIIYEILTLQKRVADLEEQARERSWQTNPDRSGGQFTDDEINRRDTW